MLSQENINKLHMGGIYRCDVTPEWLPSYKRDNPHWCRNWTFTVKTGHRISGFGNYYMRDTYWSTGDDNSIKLTDENFDKFEFLFDLDDVRKINSYGDWLEYPEQDKWAIPYGSSGMSSSTYFVRRGAMKVKDRVIERMKRDIESLKYDLENKERVLKGIMDGSVDWNLY